tara:strand:- start:736 stop:990 length:255 start_codon:yes stop_codon:yes gene_type:complete
MSSFVYENNQCIQLEGAIEELNRSNAEYENQLVEYERSFAEKCVYLKNKLDEITKLIETKDAEIIKLSDFVIDKQKQIERISVS